MGEIDTSRDKVVLLATYLNPPSREVSQTLLALLDRAEAAESLAYDLKYAAAGGEDVPGSAHAVTVADVDRWRKEHSAALTAACSRITALENALGALTSDCLARDFNEHWPSYVEARSVLSRASLPAQTQKEEQDAHR